MIEVYHGDKDICFYIMKALCGQFVLQEISMTYSERYKNWTLSVKIDPNYPLVNSPEQIHSYVSGLNYAINHPFKSLYDEEMNE